MARQRNHAAGDAEIARIATGQEGIISIGQLRGAGLSRQAVSHRGKLSRLHRIHRGVYAVGHEAVDRKGRLLAAALACGPGAAISHLSAAALWGLRKVEPVVIDVIVPCEAGRKIDGIRARRCRYPTPDELAVFEGVPCTTPSRTLVDLAGVLSRGSLRRAVEQAAVLGMLDLATLDIAMTQAKGRRGIRMLETILVAWRGENGRLPRLRSPLEGRIFPLLAEAGLPLPQCNVELTVDGHRLQVDLLWPAERLVIETDGEKTHGTRAAFQRDRWRDQLLTAAGYRVARITWRQLENERGATIARIRRMLPSASPFVSRVVP
jgi:REase_MTES_1575/AbiEi antitoxin C-terminal domain